MLNADLVLTGKVNVQKFFKRWTSMAVLMVVCGAGCSSQSAKEATGQDSQAKKQASAQQVQNDPNLSPQRKAEILRGMKLSGSGASNSATPAVNKTP